MKTTRIISLLLVAALLPLSCLVNTGSVSASAVPAGITFEKIPVKGDSDIFITGSVTLPNGAANYDDYRITAYLRIPGNPTWWGPKPTLAQPYVTINPINGRFVIQYSSHPNDLNATEIRVFLIEKDTAVPPMPTGSAVIASALIGRNDEGEVTVDGDPWEAAADYSAFDAKFPGVRKDMENAMKFSINYSPYTGTYTPMGGSVPPEDLIRRHLERIAKDFSSVRFFTAEDSLLVMYDIAHELDLKVIGTAWIDRWQTEAQIYRQLDNLIKLANDGKIMIASVGSEVLFRNDKTPAQMLTYVNYVKARISVPVPVTVMDVSGAFDGSMNRAGLAELNEALDLILFSHYPVFSNNYRNSAIIANNGGVMGYAMAELNNAYNAIKGTQGLNKPAIIAETGWPTAGDTWIGSAQPNSQNARAYWDAVHEWAKEKNIDVFWFNSFDEPWKPREGSLDARHWGVFYTDGQTKAAFKDLFAASAPIVSTPSSVNGGSTGGSGGGGGGGSGGSSGTTQTPDDKTSAATPPEKPKPHEYTTTDALEILRYVAGMIKLTPEQVKLYDFGGKGSITTADALHVLRFVAGIINKI
jgi:exo-beta-1,3-glucanase (GH17 family)